jgi:hypothetical protein
MKQPVAALRTPSTPHRRRTVWRRGARRGLTAAALATALMTSPTGLPADQSPRLIELYPSGAGESCQEEFVAVASQLQPGDELVLHGGIYSQSCRRRLSGLRGTPEQPIVIRAADGESPMLTRPVPPGHEYRHNNLEIEDAEHLVIKGLRLRGGSTGLRFLGRNRHVTLEGNEIYATGNNALAMNSGDTDHFVIRGNHIYQTGLLLGGETEGEGMYIGCNGARCIAANHLIEGNYIHHLRATSVGGNDGIEVKPGSYGIVVRDNVIHDTNIGTHYPCIFVYGGGPAPNVVEGNAMWHCGEGLQVVSDAIIRNNVVLNSEIGITAAPHAQVPRVKDVTIVNNTFYGHRECARLRWQNASNVVLANNALYCPRGKAVDATGLGGIGLGRTVMLNFVEGSVSGVVKDELQFMSGGQAALNFADVQTLDLWPRPWSPLIGTAARRLAPEADFNGARRTAPYDVGAYQTSGRPQNPGWRIGPEFKLRSGAGS